MNHVLRGWDFSWLCCLSKNQVREKIEMSYEVDSKTRSKRTKWERKEREREGGVDPMNRKHPEWIPRDVHAWLGWSGLDLGGGDWVGGWESSWTERERQKEDSEKERGALGADRCSPALQLRPHSWPGSLDSSLCMCLSFALSLFLPLSKHMLVLRGLHTWQGILCVTMFAVLHLVWRVFQPDCKT